MEILGGQKTESVKIAWSIYRIIRYTIKKYVLQFLKLKTNLRNNIIQDNKNIKSFKMKPIREINKEKSLKSEKYTYTNS